MRSPHEDIKVPGKPDCRLTVEVTRDGPVVSEMAAVSSRCNGPHSSPTPFRRCLTVSKICHGAELGAIHRRVARFTGPMQNFVYADVDGNIGYYAAAWVPIRKQGTGAVSGARQHGRLRLDRLHPV